jgi:hypothetical protein
MRARCILNDLSNIENPATLSRIARSIHLEGPIPHLSVGYEYAIEAVEQRVDGGWWLYLHTVSESSFPYPYPAELFELSVNTVPPDWCACIQESEGNTRLTRLSFAEWANEDHYYERLVDGDSHAVSVYMRRRRAAIADP